MSVELIVSVLVVLSMWGAIFFYFHRIKASQEEVFGLDPITEDMPRPPGESLRIRLNVLRDQLDELLLNVSIGVLSAGVAPLLNLEAPAKWTIFTMGIVWAVFNAIKFKALRENIHNTNLGYRGERYVGQYLNELTANGTKVYHDLPCSNNQKRFNIDHVVLGPAGVFVIETKARRKPKHLRGKSKAQVTYDGQCLAYPTFTDRHGLEQSERNAGYLSELLTSSTGMDVSVHPVLALPGWYVNRAGAGKVKVLNPKEIASGLSGKRQLDDEQITRIDHQLKLLTRCDED